MMDNFIEFDSVSDIVRRLKLADDAYYNGEPTMEDSEYDRLKSLLIDADCDNEYLANVGSPVPEITKWEKNKHNIPMASLNKCNESFELVKWAESFNVSDLIIEDKLDGISIDLEYSDGKLISATTRGDGHIGENILNNVINMQNVKKFIYNFNGNIRGEIVITKSDFHELLQHEPSFKNPRNTASGISKRYDGQYSEYLSIFYYDIIECTKRFQTEREKLNRINEFGLLTSKFYIVDSIEQAKNIMVEYKSYKREKTSYDIDALVIKINDISVQESLGYSPNGNPKGQIAWKFPNDTGTTQLINIEWSVGASGQVTPVAIFDPVFVGGAMISKASLASLAVYKELKLHKNDVIEISRRNDVIPKIEKVVKHTIGSEFFNHPVQCPYCESKLEIGDKLLKCNNLTCYSRLCGDLLVWITSIGIKGLGYTQIEYMFNEGILKTPVDFYKESFRENTIMSKKILDKIVKQLDERKKLSLDVFIDSLNMDSIRGATIRSLIKSNYNTLDKLFALNKKELSSVQGIGDIKAEQILTGIERKKSLINQLLKIGIEIIEQTEIRTGVLSGKTILFTGSMSKKRNEMKSEAEENGASVVERIQSNLDYLIVPDKIWSSDKTTKAVKLKIPIITEEEYRKILRQN
jgi:DNA ligase (NAD+)